MNEALNEVLSLLQEECAEVIQAVSKVNRFGIDSVHNGKSKREELQQEIGDVLALIMALTCRHPDLLNEKVLEAAIKKKIEKLNRHTKFLKDFDFEEAIPDEEEDFLI